MNLLDYKRLAECIRAAQLHNPWASENEERAALLVKRTIARNIADGMLREHTRFDRQRFLTECGGA